MFELPHLVKHSVEGRMQFSGTVPPELAPSHWDVQPDG